MVLGKRLLSHLRCGCLRSGHPHFVHHLADVLTHTIQVAGDELQARVPECRPAAVGERHPAVEIAGHIVARYAKDVVGVPCELACEVRRLDAMFGRAIVRDCPDQRGAGEERVGQLGEPHVIRGHAGHDFVGNSPNRCTVIAEQVRFDLQLACGPVLLHHSHEGHVAADVLPQQLVGLEQVVLVVLLEHADGRRLGQRAKVNGRRIDRGGDIHESQIRRAARQPQPAHVTNQRDVGVIDGDGELDLVVEGRRPFLAGLRRSRSLGGSERTAGIQSKARHSGGGNDRQARNHRRLLLRGSG